MAEQYSILCRYRILPNYLFMDMGYFQLLAAMNGNSAILTSHLIYHQGAQIFFFPKDVELVNSSLSSSPKYSFPL